MHQNRSCRSERYRAVVFERLVKDWQAVTRVMPVALRERSGSGGHDWASKPRVRAGHGMSISIKTQKMLWGRAASRCSLCRIELVMDATLTDDESLVGEACHIVAREPGGPRGQFDLPAERRDRYGNLILLCNVHHKQVDDQPNEYTVERLSDIKSNHEAWVREKLHPDAAGQRDDELYADYLDDWERRVALDAWKTWASWTFSSGQPRISVEMDRRLGELPEWLLGRVWPGRYEELEAAFVNFRIICRDFQAVFHEDSQPWGDDFVEVTKFYKSRDYEDDKYNYLVDLYEAHVALIECLMLELTRAANLICDLVRQTFLPNYRLREGVCLVSAGPFMPDLGYKTYRPEYRGAERTQRYPGLEPFLETRFERDFCFGKKDDNDLLCKRGCIARLRGPPR